MTITNRRVRTVLVAGIGTLFAVVGCAPAGAQDGALARRIAAAPGDVRLEYAARDGACGDGRGMVALGNIFHGSNIEGFGHFGRGYDGQSSCVPGDARVTVVRREGTVTEVRTAIGGRWSDDAGVTSLGRVGAAEAASYFMSLAESGDGRAARSALWAAALADSAPLARRFLALAMNDARPWNPRRTAMQLAGATGDASIVPELEKIARSGAGDDSIRRKKDDGNVARMATEALAVVPGNAGVDALVRLAADAPTPGVRKAAVFHAAQSDDPRGARIARTIAEDVKADEDLRHQAIFALLNRDEASGADRTWARALFGRLTSDKLRDPILMGLSQNGSVDDQRWVLSVAADEKLPVHVRRQAVFWAGQGGVPIADLLGVYRSAAAGEVREHVIFALSQRQEESATDALVDIAKKDQDREMRRKALFWLGQRKDARAMQVITEIINAP